MKPKSYRAVVKKAKKAKKAGFILKRSSGSSHEVWWNEIKKKTCVIPHHAEVKSGTLKSILNQMGLTEKEFDKL